MKFSAPVENAGFKTVAIQFSTLGAATVDPAAFCFTPLPYSRPGRRRSFRQPWFKPGSARFPGWWLCTLLLAMLGLCLTFAAHAQTVTFNFDTGTPALTPGDNVPFDQASGGVTAHFSAASGGFSVQDYFRTLLDLYQFSGDYIYPNGVNGVLVMQFSQQITNLVLNFATAEQTPIENPTPIRLIAYTNSTATPPLGSTTLAGSYTYGNVVNTFPVGMLTFSSATPFNVVTLNIQPSGATGFLVDNITVQVSGGTHYTITTSASPAAGGTTSGDGTYLSGAPVTVIATPNPGYTFVDWTENGIEVSTITDYGFAADAYRNLVANFVTPVTLTTIASPTNGGSTLGDGTYASGSTVNVTAIPNTGFAFVNWSVNGVPFSTWASCLFTVNSNETIVANFAPACTITTSSSAAAAGSASGGGDYAIGATINVVAVPNTGYAFVSWTDNSVAVSTSASYSFIGSTNRTLVANFTPNNLSVTFDFDTGTPALTNGQLTPFDQTSGGLTAHFSATNDPAFSVQSDASVGWVLSKFSSNYLAPSPVMRALDIQFSQPITNISLSFATPDFQTFLVPSTVELAAYATSAATPPVGTATAQGTYTPGDSMPMGALAFSSTTNFQLVRIALPFTPQGALAFVADNITVQTTSFPGVPTLQSSGSAGGPFADDLTATVDGAQKTITVPMKPAGQFYRLRASVSTRIVQIRLVGGQAILNYE